MFSSNERPLKRAISIDEKATLPSTTGRVLLLPCEPGNEIDEIIDAGFKLEDIDAFEMDDKKASVLRDHYGGDLMVYDQDVFDALGQQGFGPWTYVHLDLCGFMSFEDLEKIQRILPNLADNCRVRVTMYSNFRNKNQRNGKPTVQWATEMKSRNYQTWSVWYNILSSTGLISATKDPRYIFGCDPDPGLVLLSEMMFSFGFGSSYRSYREDMNVGDIYFPAIKSPYSVEGFKYLRYREGRAKNDMITTWFDLQKSDRQGKRARLTDIVNFVVSNSSYQKKHISHIHELKEASYVGSRTS